MNRDGEVEVRFDYANEATRDEPLLRNALTIATANATWISIDDAMRAWGLWGSTQ